MQDGDRSHASIFLSPDVEDGFKNTIKSKLQMTPSSVPVPSVALSTPEFIRKWGIICNLSFSKCEFGGVKF